MKRILFTIISVLFFFEIFAQGLPFIKNFTTDDYKLSAQNWEIAQDSRGYIYVANSEGLMEYDGSNWNKISINPLYSIALAHNRIYIGKVNGIGYYESKNNEKMQYFSLNHLIPKEHQEFNIIWTVKVNGEKVYFSADEKIFIYDGSKIKVVPVEQEMYRTYLVDNTVYVQDMKDNLYYFNQKDELILVKRNFDFSANPVCVMFRFNEDYTYILTDNGSFIFSTKNTEAQPIKLKNFEKIDSFLNKNNGSYGIALKNNEFTIVTALGGIIVFDINGNIKNIYNKLSGMSSNKVYYIYQDREGHIWAGLDNGISYIHHNTAFSIFDERSGVEGIVFSLSFFHNKLYVGTSQNLFVQNDQNRFVPIKNTSGQNYKTIERNDKLLAVNGRNGLMEINGNQAKNIQPIILNLSEICPLQNDTNHLIVGGSGLYLVEFKNKEWRFKHKIANFDKDIYTISQDKEGNIWASTNVEVLKIKLNTDFDSVIFCKSYNKNGLSGQNFMIHSPYSGKVLISSEKGLFSYNAVKDCFEPSSEFNQIKGDLSSIIQDYSGSIWFEENFDNGSNEKGVLKLQNGKYEMYKTPFYKFGHLDCSGWAHTICIAPDSSVYFGTNKGILHYNPKIKVNYDIPFNTYIRQVYTKDSILFNGVLNSTASLNIVQNNDLDFLHNNLTFHFAALFYEDAEKNLYSYRLLGLDSTWSEWTTDHKKDYTNLPEGTYRFEVKSMNQYKNISSTATYKFKVLPPWYRKWWAYVIWLGLSLLLIFTVTKLYARRLEAQKAHLEEVVEKRTEEIVHKNKELEQQKEEISAQKNLLENSHRQIMASIDYAQRIQNAILPAPEIIQSVLPEHFILFKPRDVVSGDFYFFKQLGDNILVIAADCTGHGVPGAFMSMLGITMLNEITQNNQAQHANDIVNVLRNKVKQALKQTGKDDEQKDGMDIAVCLINQQTLQMSFAGAYNPCLIYRKLENNMELIELKADRMPVGIHIHEKDFSEQIFQLQKDDTIYIFSDGFHSQFGLDNMEKYKTKRFKNYLQTICNKPVAEQNELLENELKNWQQQTEQTDDILVIGIKF